MDFSVILATYNRRDLLVKTLTSISRVNFNGAWEILVVDNECHPATEALVLSFQDKMPVKYLKESRRGKNCALNTALETAKGDILVFTDDDVVVPGNWLVKFKEGIDRWPDYSVFGGKVLPLWPDNKPLKYKIDLDFYRIAFCVADWDTPEGLYSAGKVWGPNMAIRKKIFDEGTVFNTEVGPSKGNYIMGSETELTTRLENEGKGSIYLPEVTVLHQIRPEQLEPEWLLSRAFRYGRSFPVSVEQCRSTHLFGMPRYFYRLLANNFFKRMITFNRSKRLNLAIQSYILKGQIYQIKGKN